MGSFGTSLKHAWNAFTNRESDTEPFPVFGYTSSVRPDRSTMSFGNDRSIVTSIYNRIALDCAQIEVCHALLDENKRFQEEVMSGLDNCIQTEANIDQTGRAFIQDVVLSLLDEGSVAIVPTVTTSNPKTGTYDINEMRVAKIINWYPQYIKVKIYNDIEGRYVEKTFPKSMCAIVENPFYATMNEPNSTLQRLKRKLVLLDRADEENNSGKLNLIIQLPYLVKSDARKAQAEARRKDIETQLTSNQYGIAYTDGTEKITQLNRSIDSSLFSQIEKLQTQLYTQLNITASIMDGSADEKTMKNYYTRVVEPIMSAIVDEMKRKFLTKNARTRGHSIIYFNDPFKLIATTELPELVDKLTRNEVMTSNEVRTLIGLKPSQDPNADELRNKNMPMQDEAPVYVDENGQPVENYTEDYSY